MDKAAVAAGAEPKEGDEEGEDYDESKEEAPGMMAGVAGSEAQGKAPTKLLPVTVLGRYAKVLMSSHEFLFVR